MSFVLHATRYFYYSQKVPIKLPVVSYLLAMRPTMFTHLANSVLPPLICGVSLSFRLAGRGCGYLASLLLLPLVLTEINLGCSTVHSCVIEEYIFKLLECFKVQANYLFKIWRGNVPDLHRIATNTTELVLMCSYRASGSSETMHD